MQDYNAILLEMMNARFENEIKKTFQSYRRWRHEGRAFTALSSPLAYSTLVTDCLLAGEGEPLSRKRRTHSIEAMLFWVVEQVQPPPPEDKTKKSWQRYYSLRDYYLEGRTAAVVVKEWDGLYKKIDEDYLNPAISELAVILRQELEKATNIEGDSGRRWHLIDRRYHYLKANEQRLLHQATIFQDPVPPALLQKLAEQIGLHNVAKCIQKLLESGLLVEMRDQLERVIQVHQDVIPYLSQLENLVSNQERRCWQRALAQHYLDDQEFAKATHYWLAAEDDEQAVHVLLDNLESFARNSQLEVFLTFAGRFHREKLSEISWTRLKIATGDALAKLKKVNDALLEYGKALNVNDTYYKALAYHRRARVSEAIHAGEAIANYMQVIGLLEKQNFEENPDWAELLFEAYVDEAWVYIQDKADTQMAAKRLSQAQKINPKRGSRHLQSKLLNAWARLFEELEEDLDRYLDIARKAYNLALETEDEEVRLITAINLGMGYVFTGELELGNQYLNEALEIALRTNHRPHEMKIRKIQGAYYFFKEEFNEAIRYYEMAAAIANAKELDDQVWLGFIYYDLAEVLAVVGRTAEARAHFNKAWAIAKRVSNQKLKRILEELASLHIVFRQPPEIELNPRQELAFEYVKQHGAINLSEYRDLTKKSGLPPVANGQASLDLRDMEKKGILERRGKGRAIYYVLILRSV